MKSYEMHYRIIDAIKRDDFNFIMNNMCNERSFRFNYYVEAAEYGRCEIFDYFMQRFGAEYDDECHVWSGAFLVAARKGHHTIVKRLLQESLFYPSMDATNIAIQMASEYGHTEVVKTLLLDERANPLQDAYSFPIRSNSILLALKNRHMDVIDLLFSDKRVYASLDQRLEFSNIAMFRSRMLQVCIALHRLNLPDLQTLKIIDFLIPNTVRRWAKIELIRRVKHFK